MSPQVTVRYWAGARRAAGRDSEQLTAASLPELLAQLNTRPALVPVLAASSVLIDSMTGREDAALTDGAVIDILPPFAGG
jgi:molybdopterin converting factor small subunit